MTEQATDNSEPNDSLPPIGGYLGKSFIAVSIGIIVYLIGSLILHGAAIALFFPEEFQALQAGPAEAEESVSNAATDSETTEEKDSVEQESEEAEPEELPTPNALFWLTGLLVHVATAFAGGWICNRLAPTTGMGHVMFVAALVFFSSLQSNLEGVFDRPAWAMGVFTLFVPLAVMIGGWAGLKPINASEQSKDDHDLAAISDEDVEEE